MGGDYSKIGGVLREILDDKNLPLAKDGLLSLRMECLQNILQREKKRHGKDFNAEQKRRVSSLETAWNNWYGGLLRLKPGSVHRLIVKWVLERNVALITMNYDLTFEKALGMGDLDLPSSPVKGQRDVSPYFSKQEVAQNAYCSRGRVWHMHEEASCPATSPAKVHTTRLSSAWSRRSNEKIRGFTSSFIPKSLSVD